MLYSVLRGLWRLFGPPRFTLQAILYYGLRYPYDLFRFAWEYSRFRRMGGTARFADIAPKLYDRGLDSQTGGGEYFLQDIWALGRVHESSMKEHHDFGSRIDGFVGQLAAYLPVTYWDIRIPDLNVPGLTLRQGDLLKLPIADHSLLSISCLHTVEHVGLGRYGDKLDPQGAKKAIQELKRIVAPGGNLLFSMPLGENIVEFNEQRRWSVEAIINEFDGLELIELSVIRSGKHLLRMIELHEVTELDSCGLFRFRKPICEE